MTAKIMVTKAEIERAKEIGSQQQFRKDVAAMVSSINGALALNLSDKALVTAIRSIGATLCRLCDLKEGKQND